MILRIEPFSGVSGDMMLGALVDAEVVVQQRLELFFCFDLPLDGQRVPVAGHAALDLDLLTYGSVDHGLGVGLVERRNRGRVGDDIRPGGGRGIDRQRDIDRLGGMAKVAHIFFCGQPGGTDRAAVDARGRHPEVKFSVEARVAGEPCLAAGFRVES